MKANELRKKTVEQLNKEIVAISKERLNLRVQKVVGEVKQTHLFKLARRNIARIKTILSEKEGS